MIPEVSRASGSKGGAPINQDGGDGAAWSPNSLHCLGDALSSQRRSAALRAEPATLSQAKPAAAIAEPFLVFVLLAAVVLGAVLA